MYLCLASETLIQNFWVNFGNHLRVNGVIPKKGEIGYIAPQNRKFSEQKHVFIPLEMIKDIIPF